MNRCRLYLITPPTFDAATFAESLTKALDADDVASVQLRLKGADDDTIRRTAEVLVPLVRERGAAFILNDRPDLARELEMDGVHIGQEDISYDSARATVGKDAIVGVTCHDSRHLAMLAAEKGADYVAFGAFFPTATKAVKAIATPEIIEIWSETTIFPCVAIGGITPDNCLPLIIAGADFLAVSASVWNHPQGPASAVRKFNDIISKIENG